MVAEKRLVSLEVGTVQSHRQFASPPSRDRGPSSAITMEPGCAYLTGAATSVHLLKLNGYCATATMNSWEYIKSVWSVDGHDWEIRCYPQHRDFGGDWVALQLVFLGEAQPDKPLKVRASLSCRPVDRRGKPLEPSVEKSVSAVFYRPQNSAYPLLLVKRNDTKSPSPYLKNDSVTAQCTITVLKELPVAVIPGPAKEEVPMPMPPSDLHQHLGGLFLSQKGADITFVVSGERFAAHKSIIAARSPVFMAEFFGHMKESHSQRVEVEDMEAAVFRAMLHFIYTDNAPELDVPLEAAVSMAEHLLAAADRYGLDRLKLICERKLSGGVDVGTAATTLALAEQHNCSSLLKAKCVEFIIGSPERLDAVLATEGYKHLAASCPLVLAELLKAAHGRKN
ncbi:unnamed protein product [Urochloa decumbens]|uniref:BTB domain-containing protein n=1 Tax=Urochloa decumbens TaxID=240449 RepID=A0ABC9EAU0_9POAL